MRKLNIREDLQSPLPLNESRINFALNSNLVQEIRNWLRLGYQQGYFATPSLGAFIKKALTAYQNQLIQLDWEWRLTSTHRTNITVRFPAALLNYYLTLPAGKRVAIVELSLLAYYQKEKEERVTNSRYEDK